jgi:hypothetical protein
MSFCSSNWPLRWVCCTSKSDLSSTNKCEKMILLATVNLVTPKAGAQYELFPNKPASEVG